ncbi:hypothetical protein BDZ89DRAFT_196076 [Hymenopellis radicata]|nr:hypothetical protein BDZ89DRAFT_196076 [Hymenopellis radicata]
MGLLQRVHEKIKLHGDDEKHEKTDSWSNRDLIPMPPERRNWGAFNYFGYWTLSSLNIATWQMPNAYLTQGLSVGQAMGVIIISRCLIIFFTTLIAWCGLTWHIGFTVQNRFSWGMYGSYIPLTQRVLLNFIWNAIQCWNGGKLVSVMIAAAIPKFTDMTGGVGNQPTTSYDFIGFFVFWICSIPFVWLPPERFRIPFLVTTLYCAGAMVCMMIWAVSVAKHPGPVFYSGQVSTGTWATSWIWLKCINSFVGGKAAGMTNGSDWGRYGKSKAAYLKGAISCELIAGTLVSFLGLVVTSCAQTIYGEIYWNPPDLLMRMMDSGHGSGKSRAGVFFLALGFASAAGFENVCGNATAGGIDLAGIFPKYINIRRGAMITFFAAWICMPWQLINRAATFVTVLSSFCVFLCPLMGIMCADYFVVRRQRIKLTELYELHGSFYYTAGFNLRVFLPWIAGWAPTVGGLALVASNVTDGPRALYKLYYMTPFLGFFISFTLFLLMNVVFPVAGAGDIDAVDVFGTFKLEEARRLGVMPLSFAPSDVDSNSVRKVPISTEEKV